MALKLKDILMENDMDEEDPIDIDRMMWNDGYLEDVAEKFGYDTDFTKQFWHQYYCPMLYHCTVPENYERIKLEGIRPRKERRGAISNRHIGPAVFTCIEEEVSFFNQYYGPLVIEINTKQMRADGLTPYVEQEPDWARARMIEFVLKKMGKDDSESEAARYVDSSDQNTEGTVIFYDPIAVKYLKLVEHE
jgi:hypothetical protein